MDSSNYVAVYGNKKENSFAAFQITLGSDSIRATDFALKFKNERILHTFTTSDGFFILTIKGRSSTIKAYKLFRSLRGTLSLSRYAYDFSDEEQDRTLPNLYKELMEFTEKGNQYLAKVKADATMPLTTAGNYFKLYQYEDKLVLTLDHIHGRTSIYEMFLNSNIKRFRMANYPTYITNKPYLYSSNSVLMGDTLVQMAVSKEDLAINLYDLGSDEFVREIAMGKTTLDSIASRLVYKDQTVEKENIAKSLSKILKEIDKGQAAFTIEKVGEENIALQIGTYRPMYDELIESTGQTQTTLDYAQSLAYRISAFNLRLDPEDAPVPDGAIAVDRFAPVSDFKTKNKINDPIIETYFMFRGHLFYCWHSLLSNRIMIRRIQPLVNES